MVCEIKQSSGLGELVKRIGKFAWPALPLTSSYDLGKRIGEMEAEGKKPPATEKVKKYCFALTLDAGKTYLWGVAVYALAKNLF